MKPSRTFMYVKILKIFLLCSGLFMVTLYASTALVVNKNDFTISFVESKDGVAEISLSEDKEFTNPTVKLVCEGVEGMTNISGSSIPNDVDSIDGSHNGDHYIAYTFYVKNTGSVDCILQEEYFIDSVVKETDAAIRIKVYRDGMHTTYAKLGSNGYPEYGTVPFTSKNVVFKNTDIGLKAGQQIRYTLVVWLEGDDPECVNDIKGGSVKMSLNFSILNINTEGETE